MNKEETIKNIKPQTKTTKFIKKYLLNRYFIVFIIFLIWMLFFDDNSFLVIKELNHEIAKYEKQVEYYKTEYTKNNEYYKLLMNDKSEKEKYARENYFMKKPNEEIFILVVDSTETNNKK